MQKIRKKFWTVKAVGPERTDTYVRTYESEFIGSFRSLKTSGETINPLMDGLNLIQFQAIQSNIKLVTFFG